MTLRNLITENVSTTQCVLTLNFSKQFYSVFETFLKILKKFGKVNLPINPKIKKKEDVVDNVIANTFVLYELNLLK